MSASDNLKVKNQDQEVLSHIKEGVEEHTGRPHVTDRSTRVDYKVELAEHPEPADHEHWERKGRHNPGEGEAWKDSEHKKRDEELMKNAPFMHVQETGFSKPTHDVPLHTDPNTKGPEDVRTHMAHRHHK